MRSRWACPAAEAGPHAAPAGAPDEPVTRREVEEVLGTLRSMIDGMVRMLDAERAAERGGEPPAASGSGGRL